MSVRDAIKAVFGMHNDPYRKIDALLKSSSQKERTVDSHHSRGTAQLLSGENVLEIDFAGSGFAAPRKMARGFNSKPTDIMAAGSSELQKQFGDKKRVIPVRERNTYEAKPPRRSSTEEK